MFATVRNVFSRKKSVNAGEYPCNLKFRVVFVSPFFELEVDSGNGWKTVHSQDGEPVGEEGSMIYPILRFKSFNDGVTYATQTLGLFNMNPSSLFGIYTAPPVSYMNDVQPRVVQPKYFIEGDETLPPKVKAHRPNPTHQIAPFVLYGGQAKAA